MERQEEEERSDNNVVVMLCVSGLSREECKKLKAKRRTLKNRGYAASCRHKRDNEEGDLQGEKMELEVTESRIIVTLVLSVSGIVGSFRQLVHPYIIIGRNRQIEKNNRRRGQVNIKYKVHDLYLTSICSTSSSKIFFCVCLIKL